MTPGHWHLLSLFSVLALLAPGILQSGRYPATTGLWEKGEDLMACSPSITHPVRGLSLLSFTTEAVMDHQEAFQGISPSSQATFSQQGSPGGISHTQPLSTRRLGREGRPASARVSCPMTTKAWAIGPTLLLFGWVTACALGGLSFQHTAVRKVAWWRVRRLWKMTHSLLALHTERFREG